MSGDRKVLGILHKQHYHQPIIQEMAKQKQQQLQDKINRQISKQMHIIKIQQELEDKLRRKNQQILRKLNKSVQAKKTQIQKYKQKCNMRIKYETQKADAFKKKQKAMLHKSWRQSLRLSQQINNRTSEHRRRVVSQVREQKYQSINQQDFHQQMPQVTNANRTNKFLPMLENRKRQIMSTTRPVQRSNDITNYRGFGQPNSKNKFNRSLNQQIYNREQMGNSSTDFLQKVREKSKQRQKQQIKKFNQKLQKLEQARMKKQKIQKQRQKKIHDILQYKNQKLKQIKRLQKQKQKAIQSKRIKTLGNQQQKNNLFNSNVSISNKNIQFRKWQQQLFECRLKKGEDYMQSMKVKSNINKKSREIQMNSIEKKLYMQRIRMFELMKISNKAGC